MSEVVSRENFEEWNLHPVTRRLMRLLHADRETLKEGLVQNAFENEEEVKGRCRAIALILSLEYEDLYQSSDDTKKGTAYVQ
jgi:hypothetical protein